MTRERAKLMDQKSFGKPKTAEAAEGRMPYPARRVSCLASLVVAAIWLAGQATAVLAQEDHAYTAAQIQDGYRLYASQCQLCHGANGDSIGGSNLGQQQFRLVKTDDDIRHMIATGSPKGMPQFTTLKPEEVDALIAFIRSGMDRTALPFRIGVAARGKALYDANGCANCHRIAGQGARTAPDLTDIGYNRRPGQIFTSLTDPIKATMPINRPVVIVLKDGKMIKGRRLDEDTLSVRLIDSDEMLRSIPKAQVRSYEVRKNTDMPSFRGRLSDTELGDLVAYLATLKG